MKKLNKHQVRRIRVRYYSTDVTLSDLAESYDVTDHCIGKVVRGETWEHVGGPTEVDPDKGYTTHSSKLTDQQRQQIKRRREAGESLGSIASDYPVGKTQVCNITTGDGDSNFGEDLELDRTIDLPLTSYDFLSEVPA